MNAIEQLFSETLEQMRGGGWDGPIRFDHFVNYTADYPADAWLADYVRHGGNPRRAPYAVERELLALARERLS